ncbi:hypothetical protein CFOL_v3_19026 [Cephalotus follicularis]|uniref:Putative plant transposon protein domain-containing protein n=1 Tax=Cephalotus follicularis TaxID=3775 RepID=A0A1Q3C5M0_CEPFO|nr:hypothetical protein CFOL_v3_19026 [Cephalotus follicularis]
MKEFYANILVSSDYDLFTRVKNRNFEIDTSTITSILTIPIDGSRAWCQRCWTVGGDFSKEECVHLLFVENTQVLQKMYSRNLRLDYRFLHRAIATHILPKVGGFDEVTHLEAFTMFHIITGRRICVLSLILNHMRAMQSREIARLPYSNIITKIFMHFDLDLDGEVHHALQNSDKLGKGTLGMMGFKKHKRLGTWVPKDEDSDRVNGEEGEEEVQGEEEIDLQADPTLVLIFLTVNLRKLCELLKFRNEYSKGRKNQSKDIVKA